MIGITGVTCTYHMTKPLQSFLLNNVVHFIREHPTIIQRLKDSQFSVVIFLPISFSRKAIGMC